MTTAAVSTTSTHEAKEEDARASPGGDVGGEGDAVVDKGEGGGAGDVLPLSWRRSTYRIGTIKKNSVALIGSGSWRWRGHTHL